jgi:hypothetical protein
MADPALEEMKAQLTQTFKMSINA